MDVTIFFEFPVSGPFSQGSRGFVFVPSVGECESDEHQNLPPGRPSAGRGADFVDELTDNNNNTNSYQDPPAS